MNWRLFTERTTANKERKDAIKLEEPSAKIDGVLHDIKNDLEEFDADKAENHLNAVNENIWVLEKLVKVLDEELEIQKQHLKKLIHGLYYDIVEAKEGLKKAGAWDQTLEDTVAIIKQIKNSLETEINEIVRTVKGEKPKNISLADFEGIASVSKEISDFATLIRRLEKKIPKLERQADSGVRKLKPKKSPKDLKKKVKKKVLNKIKKLKKKLEKENRLDRRLVFYDLLDFYYLAYELRAAIDTIENSQGFPVQIKQGVLEEIKEKLDKANDELEELVDKTRDILSRTERVKQAA